MNRFFARASRPDFFLSFSFFPTDGTQCFCATSLDLTKATISTGCNMAAGGAQTELAGGGEFKFESSSSSRTQD